MKLKKGLFLITGLIGSVALFFTLKQIISKPKKRNVMPNKKYISKIAPNIDMNEKAQKVSINILNKVLADEFVLFVQTLNYHWNLIGPEFNDYHKLFDDQYHAIFEIIDAVAERTRSVGGLALGSMQEFIEHANLQEDHADTPSPKQMIKNLLDQHEALIKILRQGINETAIDNRDMGTNNHLTDLLEKHEKMAWMLRSLSSKKQNE